ncbi:MAG: carotenoid biosynthesis protein [Cyclobacteriaceae bacterium]
MNFKSNEILAGSFILILHIVGVAGYLIPVLQPYFILLTPFNLLLTGALTVFLHYKNNESGGLILFSAFAIGLLVEIIGVATGFPFGEYSYGSTLGFKIMKVPLIIGMNWLVLGYGYGSIAKKIFPVSKWVAIVLAASAMVLTDVLIEPVAIRYDYWSWQQIDPPLLNYIGWFVVALVIQFLMQRLDLQKLYKFCLLVLVSQLLFFVLLNILSVD